MNPENSERRKRAAAALEEAKLDALLVTSLHNIRYLTGFTGSNGWLSLRAGGRAIFFTDPRYTVQAGQEVDCLVRVAKGPLVEAAVRDLEKARPRRIGFEQDHMNVAQAEVLRRRLPARSELTGASVGIGYRLQEARQIILMDRMFVGLIELGVLGALVDTVFVLLSRWLIHWEQS